MSELHGNDPRPSARQVRCARAARCARELARLLAGVVVLAALTALSACSSSTEPREEGRSPAAARATSPSPGELPAVTSDPQSATETATLAAGCFWCIEAVLEQLEGVRDVRSGYMGGHVDKPTYKQVCTGNTGHAEVVQVDFDPAQITFAEVLDWFWRLHDPTTLNRQGNDVGTQYRSAIFVHSPEQRRVAEASRAAAQAGFEDPIVTEITEASTFFVAEADHQDYYRRNRAQAYCQIVIAPKLDKLGLDP